MKYTIVAGVLALVCVTSGVHAQDGPPVGTWRGDLQKWSYDEAARQVIINADGSCRWGFVRENHTPGLAKDCVFDPKTGRLTLTTTAGSRVELTREGEGWVGSFVVKSGYSVHTITMMRPRESTKR